jgi:3-methyladenine DNA glycosylase/8-oxoguanine DNA glycosylase
MTQGRLRDFAHRHFGPLRGYAQQFLFHWARLTDCGAKE